MQAQSTPSPTVLGDEAHVSHQELVIHKVLPSCLPEDMEEELHTTDAEALWKHMLWKHMLWKLYVFFDLD